MEGGGVYLVKFEVGCNSLLIGYVGFFGTTLNMCRFLSFSMRYVRCFIEKLGEAF